MTHHRHGAVFAELLALLAGLSLFGTLVGVAVAAVRQRQQVEASSARLEDAQNLLARWRAGEAITEADWQVEVQALPVGEVLTLRRPGVRLSTIRVPAGGPP